ncbi:MAG: peptide chain release factor 1 [Spirochaetes bacterium]|nr:peptide chain release factor 1 [Deltaproteobacteria bacterium]RKX97859.1 MAG: peptide chain release factor 1 [Spirochaetota bacterium]
MFQKLEEVEKRYNQLNNILADPDLMKDPEKYQKVVKEHADLSRIFHLYQELKRINKEIEDNKNLLEDKDEEIKNLAKEELKNLSIKKGEISKQLKEALVPKDPNDEKNVILEIRAGTGGDEAALFVADLFRMYSRYAEEKKWKVDIMNSHPTGIGGFKEIILLIEGRRVYSRLKYESGVHRVQRVPTTESQGRIHTSAVTVAVLPEAEEVEVEIDPKDIRVDIFRSSGPGGQSVNTTDSAVRITHIPTGIVVSCQDEKSQHKNKAKAMKVLRARLKDKLSKEQEDQISMERKSQVGSGDRSERIRTYNFPQGRVTDHRIGLTLYKLEDILQGNLDDIIDPLITHFNAEALKKAS